MMTKARSFLSLCEDYTVTVALHDPGHIEDNEYYANAHIFGFELWGVPSIDPIVSKNRVVKSYVGLFNNMVVISKKDIRKYNLTKQRIFIERSRAERVYIPDKVWKDLNISEPRKDQKLLLQCLYILYKSYKVRIFGMQDFSNITRFWE
jgi:hypothetical protein